MSKSETVKVLHTALSSQIVQDLHCLYHNESGHDLPNCGQFGRLGWSAKRTHATEWKLCFNCLQPHYANRCPKTWQCGIYGASHIDAMHWGYGGKFAPSFAEQPRAPTSAWTPSGQSKLMHQAYNYPPPPIVNRPSISIWDPTGPLPANQSTRTWSGMTNYPTNCFFPFLCMYTCHGGGWFLVCPCFTSSKFVSLSLFYKQ